MPLVTDPYADGANARVSRQTTCIAEVVVLILEVLAGTQESAFVFRFEHILCMVRLTVVKHFFLEALQGHWLFLFVSILLVSIFFQFFRGRKNGHFFALFL